MALHMLLLIFLVQQIGGVETNGTSNYFLRLLDGLQFIHTGREKYDRTIYGKVTTCMNRIDPTLIDFMDSGWKSVVEFWIEKKEEWGNNLPYTAANGNLWEKNLTLVPNFEGLVLQEPCNVASYQSHLYNFLKICERMDEGPGFNLPEEKVKVFTRTTAFIAFAGSFYHASRNRFTSQLIGPLDDSMYNVVYNNVVELLPTNSTIIKHFGEWSRGNADQIVNEFHTMVITKNYKDWQKDLSWHNVKKYPYYVLGLTSIFSCIFEPENPIELFERVFEYLSYFLRMTDEMKIFFVQTFIPEVQNVIPLMNLTTAEVETLQQKSYKVAAAFAYSIIYYGENPMKKTFNIVKYPSTNPDEFFTKKMLRLKVPFASFVAEMASKNNFYNDDFEIYPGKGECERKYGHPKWHKISKEAFREAMFFVDDFYGMMKKKKDLLVEKEATDAAKQSQRTDEEVNKLKSEKETENIDQYSSSSSQKKETNKRNTIVITLS